MIYGNSSMYASILRFSIASFSFNISLYVSEDKKFFLSSSMNITSFSGLSFGCLRRNTDIGMPSDGWEVLFT